MKNIFKFLGIALMASAMMVACGDKENTDGTDTTPVTPPAPTSSFTMNFDGTAYTIIDFQAVDHTSDGYITVYGYTTAQGENGIYTNGFLEATVVSNATYQSTGGDIMNFRDPSFIYVDVDGLLGDPNTSYWGWNCSSSTFVENVTAVDLNALTMSANWTVQVFSITDYIDANGDLSGVTLHPFTGEMVNAKWTWASK